MRIKYVILFSLLCILLIASSVYNVNAEPSELYFDNSYSGPYVDKVLYKVIGTESARVQALLDNEIDILDGPISAAQRPALEADPDIELSSNTRNGYGHIIINCRKDPLNYSVLRRAFAYAFNKTQVPNIIDDVEQLYDSLVPAVSTFCVEDEFDWNYYTSQSAIGNQMLNDSGFAIDGGTGFRLTPHGDSFDVTIEYSAGSTLSQSVAQLGVDALLSLHIDAETHAGDFNEIYTRLYAHGDYDMVFTAKNFYNDDVDWLVDEFWSDNDAVLYKNPSNFRNSTFDGYIDQLLYDTSYTAVFDASREMQKILHYNVPQLVVYENNYYSAYRTDCFEGYVIDNSKNVANEWTNLKAHHNPIDGGPFSGTLRISMNGEPETFNPMKAVSAYAKTILDNLLDSLFRTGPDGNRVLGLASSYTQETHADNPAIPVGHTRFTIDIISNATWSDGTPFTADDVAYTMTYYYESYNYGNPIGTGLADLTASYAPLPTRAIIEFNTESYWHISTLTDLPILQKTLLQSIGYSGWDSWNPIKSSDLFPTLGPFNVTSYSSSSVELSYYPDFHHRVRGTGSDLPSITSPSDMVVVNGTIGHSISWTLTDDNPLVYHIYNNGTIIEADYINAPNITIAIDSELSDYGTYNFTIQALDWEYQNATDTVLVEYVPDTFDPVISGPDDLSIPDVATDDSLINWIVYDDNPVNYSVYLDGSEEATLSWSTGQLSISYDIPSLTIGVYNFTIILRDLYGNSATDTVIITVVQDTTPPEVIGPDDIQFNLGESGMSILWNATDDYPDTYSIFVEGVEIATGSWITGIPIEFSLDELTAGQHNVTIAVYDLGGNMVSDTVIVTVQSGFLTPELMMLLGVGGVIGIVAILVVVKVKGGKSP